jgi:GxxExxY protein
MQHNEITGVIVDTAMDIHRRLGSGLLETAYRKILAYELRKKGLDVQEEQSITLVWEEIEMEAGFRADIIVNRKVIVELKSVETVANVHKKQLLTYVRLADMRVGLLINFGEELLKTGIHRVVNNLVECREAVT